jgi:hypothetical protein
VEFKEDNLLTAIIPLTSESERVHNVCKIIKACESLPITIVIVFDSRDQMPTSLLDAIGRRSTTTLLIQGFWNNPGESRNAGLSMVSTKWVIFWDSDDLPFPMAVHEMIKLAEAEIADCCIGGFELESQLGTKIFTPAKGNWVDSALAYPGLWRFAFRVSIIQDKNFSNYRMGEDQEFLARALHSSKKMFVTTNLVYRYRTGGGTQLTKSYSDFSELLNVFDSLYRLEKAFTAQATRLTGVMKAKIALTTLKKGTPMVKLKMFFKISSRLLNYRAFTPGEVGNGLLVSILLRIKGGRSG